MTAAIVVFIVIVVLGKIIALIGNAQDDKISDGVKAAAIVTHLVMIVYGVTIGALILFK